MEKISEMIKRACQDVVEYIKLGEVAEIGTGSGNRQDAVDDGGYPFFVRSKEVLHSNTYEFDEEAILIPGEGGIGDIFHYYNGKYALHQRTYRIHAINKDLCTKFLFYYLFANFKAYILRKAVASTATSIRKPMIENYEIPLPPLSIQQEIVRILDSFTQLQSNLEAELVVRQKQYEFYRNKLFTFDKDDDSVERKKLEEISIDIFSGATPSTKIKEYWDGGTIPWMSSGEVHQGQVTNIEGCITELGYSKCSTKLVPINSVVIALAGQGKTRGTVAITRMSLCTNQSLAAIVPNTEIVNPDYLYFYLKGEYMNLRTVSSGDGTRGGLNLRMINEYKVPIVSIQRQQEIVSILDTFESLITNLKKEIEVRKKQYEYYREQLLTFE